MDGERTKQDSAAPVILAGTPFVGFGGSFGSPFRENNVLAKADYALGGSAKAFYKYSYFSNSLFATFGLGYSVYDNKDVTRQHVVGLDWSTGTLSHSIRFTYLKFQNQIVDATLGDNSLPLCCTGLELSSSSFFVGPNLLAPQSTPQSNHQIKYNTYVFVMSKFIMHFNCVFNSKLIEFVVNINFFFARFLFSRSRASETENSVTP